MMKYPEVEKILATNGSGWGSFEPGSPVYASDFVYKGDLILVQSNRFDAKNVAVVRDKDLEGVYLQFVNPNDTKQLRRPDDKVFKVWDFELEHQNDAEYFLPAHTVSSSKQDVKRFIQEMLEGQDLNSFESFEDFYQFLDTSSWYDQLDSGEELSVVKELVREAYEELKR